MTTDTTATTSATTDPAGVGIPGLTGLNVEAYGLFAAEGNFAQGRARLYDGDGQPLYAVVPGGEPQRVSVVRTLGDFFGLFGVRPYLGRFYRPEDSAPGAEGAVVASYGFWQQVLGSDPPAVGRSVELNGNKFQVIGVLPADFSFPRSAQLYAPFTLDPLWLSPQRRSSVWWRCTGNTCAS